MTLAIAAPTVVPASAGDLYARHRGFVRGCLRRMGVRADGLEDAEQDVFLVLVRRLHDFDGRHEHRRWLWGIARRVAWSYRRKQGRGAVPLSSAPVPSAVPTLDERLTLARVLDDLDEDQLVAYLLHELHGHTAREIAQRLELPLTTVQWRIRSARKRLREATQTATVGARLLWWPGPWAGLRRWKLGTMTTAKLAVSGGLVAVALAAGPGPTVDAPTAMPMAVEDEVDPPSTIDARVPVLAAAAPAPAPRAPALAPDPPPPPAPPARVRPRVNAGRPVLAPKPPRPPAPPAPAVSVPRPPPPAAAPPPPPAAPAPAPAPAPAVAPPPPPLLPPGMAPPPPPAPVPPTTSRTKAPWVFAAVRVEGRRP